MSRLNGTDFATKAKSKALKLAAVDLEINGDYINAPYDLTVDNVRLKARVRKVFDNTGEGGRTTCVGAVLEIIQPETFIANTELDIPQTTPQPATVRSSENYGSPKQVKAVAQSLNEAGWEPNDTIPVK